MEVVVTTLFLSLVLVSILLVLNFDKSSYDGFSLTKSEQNLYFCDIRDADRY
jgi:hypothetical protein